MHKDHPSSLRNRRSRKKRNNQRKGKHSRIRIFVHGLHPLTTAHDIYQTFGRVCRIYSLDFKKDKRSGKHKGFAFFEVTTRSEAQKLLHGEFFLWDRKIQCELQTSDHKKIERDNKKRIFVGGIRPETTDEDLFQAFYRFGEIRSAYAIKDISGCSKGFGYVDFYSADSAKRAYEEAFNLVVRGRLVDVRPFEMKKKEAKGKKQNRRMKNPSKSKLEENKKPHTSKNNNNKLNTFDHPNSKSPHIHGALHGLDRNLETGHQESANRRQLEQGARGRVQEQGYGQESPIIRHNLWERGDPSFVPVGQRRVGNPPQNRYEQAKKTISLDFEGPDVKNTIREILETSFEIMRIKKADYSFKLANCAGNKKLGKYE